MVKLLFPTPIPPMTTTFAYIGNSDISIVIKLR